MASRPQNIGIKAIEIYFPSQVYRESSSLLSFIPVADRNLQCVDQAELEKFDGVSQGKYTIGHGQTKMSFCDDREGKSKNLHELRGILSLTESTIQTSTPSPLQLSQAFSANTP